MESMVNSLAEAWKSERLTYRVIEDNDADKALLYACCNNAVDLGLAFPALLKPYSQKDVDELLASLQKSTIMTVLMCLSAEESKKAVEGRTEEPDNASKEEALKPTPIGFLSLSKPGHEAMAHCMNTQIALTVRSAYQNKGYGREAINWALDWSFRYANRHRVAIGTVSFNTRALHLYKSIGFVEEGRRREVVYMNLQWHDLIEMSMLVDEWRALRGLNK